jgi:hypothetical protein
MASERTVSEIQLSGRGYRKNPEALDPARSLWDSEDAEEMNRLIALYSPLCREVTKGKVVYGPQTGRPKSEVKNATDVHEKYDALMTSFESVDEVRMSLEEVSS